MKTAFGSRGAWLILEAATKRLPGRRTWILGKRHETMLGTCHELHPSHTFIWAVGYFVISRNIARLILRGLLFDKLVEEFREWVYWQNYFGDYSLMYKRDILAKLDEVKK